MSFKHENPGHVDVERALEGILDNPGGGGVSSKWEGDHIHNSAYIKDENHHLSWDEYPDGRIENVYTDRNGSGYTWYGEKKK